VDVLDTDVLIDLPWGHPAAVAWFAGLPALPTVPGPVVLELVQGARDARDLRQRLAVVAPLPVAWPTAADGQRALVFLTAYRLSHGLGLVDALVAATVVGLGGRLRTFYAKHCRPIPGPVAVPPYTR
jgi:hypothetical protein